MQGLANFILSPKGNQQYITTENIAGFEFTTTTSIQDHLDVNRIGIVVSLPIGYKGNAKVGDEVVCWQNVFRISYDNNGVPIQSDCYIRENLFSVDQQLIYMIIRNGDKIALDENVFITPEYEEDYFEGNRGHQHVGRVKYSNKSLEEQGIRTGDKICFRRNCEHEFEIEGEKLYRMLSHRILAKITA